MVIIPKGCAMLETVAQSFIFYKQTAMSKERGVGRCQSLTEKTELPAAAPARFVQA